MPISEISGESFYPRETREEHLDFMRRVKTNQAWSYGKFARRDAEQAENERLDDLCEVDLIGEVGK